MERSESGQRSKSVLSVQLSIFSVIFCGEFRVGKTRETAAPPCAEGAQELGSEGSGASAGVEFSAKSGTAGSRRLFA